MKIPKFLMPEYEVPPNPKGDEMMRLIKEYTEEIGEEYDPEADY